MKTNRRSLITQRQLLDRNLKDIRLKTNSIPQSGWLKAVRSTLGLSIRQMAKRLKVSPVAIVSIEKNEVSGKASLSSIDRSARAMDCHLVWAVVPSEGHGSLEEILDSRAHALAKRLMSQTAHSMRLENQSVSPEEMANQEAALASELKAKADPRLWDENF
jgi:predicted DNA-binding mobile mystery protein A